MRSVRSCVALGSTLLLGACSCGENNGLGTLKGNLTTQMVVDFGDVQVGILVPLQLAVKNAGNGALVVSKTELADNFSGPDYEFKVSPNNFPLAPTETRMLTVSFQPFAEQAMPVESTFTLDTDESDGMGGKVNVVVTVRGRGIKSGLEVVPDPVDFGTVLVGSSASLDVKITNKLSIPVDVTTKLGSDGRAQITNQSGNGRFEITSDIQPNGSLLAPGAMLAPEAAVTVRARYIPDPSQEGRQDRGKWVIANCNTPLCERPVTMLGIGTNAAIQCDPSALDFGDVNPETTATKQIHCKNVATENIAVTGWSLGSGTASEFHVAAYNGMPGALAPNAEFSIDVQFKPTLQTVMSGVHPTGALVITGRNPRANRDLTPTRVSITGNAGGPNIAVSPPMMNFGQIGIGTSGKKHLLVENAGYSDLTVSMINPDVSATGLFTASRTAGVVMSGQSMVVDITFTPTALGVVHSEVLISSNDADTPETHVPLQGEGADLPPCSYTISPATVNFGIVPVLHTTTQGVRIDNTGTNDCLVSDLNVLGTSVTSSNAFGLVRNTSTSAFTIPAGSSKAIVVEYTPPREEVDTANLGFYISAPGNSTPTVPLHGVGSASALLISPNEVDFGKIGVNCSTRDRTITIYNTGALATVINKIELGPGTSSEFLLTNIPAGIPAPPGAGATIQPGASIEFDVHYHANDVGIDTGLINIFEGTRTDPYVVPLYGEGSTDPVNEDRYTQLQNPQVDILFMVDNSCSMSEEQASLTSNFSSFIQFAVAQGLDYQIAVVTTDVEGGFSGVCPDPAVAQRPLGLDQGACGYFADGNHDNSQMNPDWRIVGPNEQPSPDVAFTAIATQGTDGSGNEQGLEATYEAFSAPRISGWNAGFIRQDAYLAVIEISDEEDHSPQSVDFYINFFKAIKGFRNTNLFSLSAITGDVPGGCATAEAGTRYVEAANRTGGIFQSICTSDWATALQNLGLAVFGYKSRFFLGNQPVPGSVQVLVDGVVIVGQTMTGQVRWTYDQASNSVNFAPLAIPEPGSEIVIRYSAECL